MANLDENQHYLFLSQNAQQVLIDDCQTEIYRFLPLDIVKNQFDYLLNNGTIIIADLELCESSGNIEVQRILGVWPISIALFREIFLKT